MQTPEHQYVCLKHIVVMMLQARFTEALIKDKAKIDFSAERIFSTAETGQPKSEVLKQLEQRHPGTSYHFVEDKMGTLDKVCSSPLMHKHGKHACHGCTICSCLPTHAMQHSLWCSAKLRPLSYLNRESPCVEGCTACSCKCTKLHDRAGAAVAAARNHRDHMQTAQAHSFFCSC